MMRSNWIVLEQVQTGFEGLFRNPFIDKFGTEKQCLQIALTVKSRYYATYWDRGKVA